MLTDVDTNCPFCQTPYVVAIEKPEVKQKERKVPVKTEKESFKIWKDFQKENEQ